MIAHRGLTWKKSVPEIPKGTDTTSLLYCCPPPFLLLLALWPPSQLQQHPPKWFSVWIMLSYTEIICSGIFLPSPSTK